ncbi:MAG: class A beta-lactamase-related serine hydrolase [Opitutus sp.]|nr:class A beta-lactamase-related serine hydrolase [Opitutus sp.]
MKNPLFARTFILVTTLGLPMPAFSQPIPRPEAVPALDRLLQAAVDRKDIPGVVAFAADRRGVVYQGAFARAETAGADAGALTTGAIFRIASMTKAVTSAALMQLVEAGRLALDDPAAKYLPQLANPMVFESFDVATGAYKLRLAAKPITVRHLLTHTSGLGYGFTSATLRDFKPREGERFEVGPLLFEPGTDWVYGTGIDWVGRLVESLSGQTLEAYFQTRIFGPLKMPDTSYNVPAEKQVRVVNVYRRLADGSFEERPRTAPKVATSFNGGGGLYSTAADYLRFLRMVLNSGELDGVRILSRDTVALMGRNHIGDVGVRAIKSALPEMSSDFTFVADQRDKWGLGFQITTDDVAGKRAAGSLSWGGINNTYFWVDPSRGVAGVILMQFLPFADARALAVYDEFERGVYQLNAGRGAAKQP